MGPHPRVEEAAGLCARIIRERWFGDDSGAVAYERVRILLERNSRRPWPDGLAEEIRTTLKSFEAGAIDEPELVDWVGSWVAQAKRHRGNPSDDTTA
jgi:hypothetical protein